MTDIQPVVDAPRYPLVTLQNALEVAKAVADAGGLNSDVPKSIIASQLRSSQTSGAFLQRLGSARSFGMIEGRGAYRLTDSAKRYFFPANDRERVNAQLAFLGSPIVFNEIIKRFDGNRLPTQEMLANIIHREFGVSDSWKERVAGAFVKAAQNVGAVDSQNFLRYRASLDGMETVSAIIQATPSAPNEGQQERSPLRAVPGRSEGNCWVSQAGQEYVRVESSATLSLAMWQKLQAYVQVLRPAHDQT